MFLCRHLGPILVLTAVTVFWQMLLGLSTMLPFTVASDLYPPASVYCSVRDFEGIRVDMTKIVISAKYPVCSCKSNYDIERMSALFIEDGAFSIACNCLNL